LMKKKICDINVCDISANHIWTHLVANDVPLLVYVSQRVLYVSQRVRIHRAIAQGGIVNDYTSCAFT
jgi:hypothetical protein